MAIGDTLVTFSPMDNSPPAATFASYDVRNNHAVLDFDAATQEEAAFEGVMPRHYTLGSIKVRIGWMASTATSGNCVWRLAFERHQEATDDLDADGYGATKDVVGASPGTSGMVRYTEVTFTAAEADAVAAGESFRLIVARAAVDAADTMAGDAELHSVEIVEA